MIRPLLVVSETPEVPREPREALITPFEVEASTEPSWAPTSILPLLERARRCPQVHLQATLALAVVTSMSPFTSLIETEPLLERARIGRSRFSRQIFPLVELSATLVSRGTRSSRWARP